MLVQANAAAIAARGMTACLSLSSFACSMCLETRVAPVSSKPPTPTQLPPFVNSISMICESQAMQHAKREEEGSQGRRRCGQWAAREWWTCQTQIAIPPSGKLLLRSSLAPAPAGITRSPLYSCVDVCSCVSCLAPG